MFCLKLQKNLNMSIVRWVFFLFISAVLLFSCKKKIDTPVNSIVVSETKTYQQLLADSLFKYAQQIYYWNTFLTDSNTFKPLDYVQADTLAGLKSELLALTRLPKNPSNSNKPYEQAIRYVSGIATDDNSRAKYSYFMKTSDVYNGGVISFDIANQSGIADMKMTLDGTMNDLGFSVGLVPVNNTVNTSVSIPYTNKDSVVMFVRYVTKGSSADNVGLKRGDIIANKELDYNVSTAAIANALNADVLNLILYRPTTNKRDTLPVIRKLVYTFNPIFRDTIVAVGNKKIAYIAYQSFTSPENSLPALNNSFLKFADATDIVVDLRHNGGGYVESASDFLNLLAPSNANNKDGFVEYYTSTMVNKQATILKNQSVYINNIKQNYSYYDVDYSISKNTTKISKKGSFNQTNNIQNIYFIVSSSTASASELLVNSLKPYYNVYLVGARFSDYGYKTYGKPVGFFEKRLGIYSLYLASFETKNALGNGGYYDGISTDFQAFDDVKFNFGDPNESCFKMAIQKITGNPNYSPLSSARSVYANTPIGITIGHSAEIHDMIAVPRK